MSNIIELQNVSKKYGQSYALNQVSLSLEKGKIIGLCGPNGAGKTTMIKILVGLLKDHQGTVTVGGRTIGVETKAMISYLPDYEVLSKYETGEKIIDAYKDLYADFNEQTCRNLFHRMGLTTEQSFGSMSKGMREKFQLAVCLSRDAEVYIIDEPIAAVDPASRDSILDTILSTYSKDSLLLIATHIIQDIESVLDEVVFLQQGRVVLHRNCDELREERGLSIDEIFREEFKW